MARASVLSTAVRVEPKKAERESAAEVARAVRSRSHSLMLQLPDGTSVPLPPALVEVLRGGRRPPLGRGPHGTTDPTTTSTWPQPSPDNRASS